VQLDIPQDEKETYDLIAKPINKKPTKQNEIKQRSSEQVFKEIKEELNLESILEESKSNSKTMQNKENLKTKSVVQGQKYQIDLGCILNIEQKLWSILDWFSLEDDKSIKVFEHWEEWWDLVDSQTLSTIHSIFSVDDLRRALRKSSILEFLAITMINFLSSESRTNKELHSNLKVLIFYVHQNYLIMVNCVLQKLPPYNNTNIWVKSCKKLIKKKMSKQIFKGTTEATITSNNIVISTLLEFIGNNQRKSLKNIINEKDIRKATKPIFSTTLNIWKYIERISIKKAKDLITKAIETTNKLIIESMPKKPQGLLPIHANMDHGEMLPPVSIPYLPPSSNKSSYTLVLDLDETLVHYVENDQNSKLLIRPGAQIFLQEMAEIYELVIFTAAMQDYADWALNQLDTTKCISHRLYRQHTSIDKGVFIKDLSKIGRDLNKTIIVDNIAENFSKQPENGILIKSWYEDPKDDALFELGPLLKLIISRKTENTRG
jgi:CTD small phosphatase-like protein 2